MARKSNIRRSSVRTLIVGADTPLSSVTVYSPGFGGKERFDLTASCDEGNTTQKLEMRLTPSGARELARKIVRECGDLTPSDVGIYGWIEAPPKEEESTPQSS